jgi:predicted nucleic acid-binding protein
VAGDGAPVVIDASVAVKWFVTRGENGVDAATDLLTAHSRDEIRLACPALMVHELMHVLRRRSREVHDLPNAMEAFFDSAIMVFGPDRELMTSAARLCAENSVSTADSAYAALAMLLDCEFVTADRSLARCLAGIARVRQL